MAQEADGRAHGPGEGRRRLPGTDWAEVTTPPGPSPGCQGSACSQPRANQPPPEPPRPGSPMPTADVHRPHLGLQPCKQDGGSTPPPAKAQTCTGRTPKAGGASPPQPALARLRRIWGQGLQQGGPQTWAMGCHLSQERAERILGPASGGGTETEGADMQGDRGRTHAEATTGGGVRGQNVVKALGCGHPVAGLTEAPGSW